MKKQLLSLISCCSFGLLASSQILINEVQITNLSTLMDEDGEYSDWVELYNASAEAIQLEGFRIHDKTSESGGWTLGNHLLPANQHQLIYLSGKDRQGIPGLYDHYEIAIYPEMIWNYVVPSEEPASNWRDIGFDASTWTQGMGGIGYDDGDDNTIIAPPAASVFARTTFQLTDASAVALFMLNMDYDDAFVAYLNGVEIARANIGQVGVNPAFSSLADAGHEANGYQGLEIDNFVIDINLVQSLLIDGENVFALQIHNADPNSSDLTGNAYVVLGMTTAQLQTNAAPEEWETGETADHSNFGLSIGETLVLFDASNAIVDSLTIPAMQPDIAMRRSVDGGDAWCFTAQPTPAASNAGDCFATFEEPPMYSMSSGLYPQAIYLSLSSSNPNATIRYTTDGSKPNDNSAIYTEPLAIGATSVISARCFSDTALPSLVKKNTYLIDETSIEIPVISVSTDPANLWDEETGIHVFGPPDYQEGVPYWGANFWEDWEREAYVEYFDSNHQKQMEGPVGIKIHGGWSRSNVQKSLRIQAKGKYGMEELQYPLITDKPYITSYRGFNLRNGGNAYWDYRFHEALIERTHRNTHADYMAYEPVVVFVNGEYWGFMEIRENLDQHYIANNHDISSNDVTVVSANYLGFNVISGTPDSFFSLHEYATANDPSSDTYYENVSQMLDIANYADYLIGQTYWGNGDWSNGYQNNTKLWHDDRDGGKWRFMLMDMDFGMGLAGASPFDNYIVQAGGDGFLTDQLFDAVIQNPTFRTYFINRYADLINTEFQSSVVTEMGMAMKAEVESIFQRHAQRWGTDGGALEGTLNARLDWASQRVQGARDVVQQHFSLPGQVLITLEALPAGAGRIQISTIQPGLDDGPWQGVYFNGVPVKVTAYANPGFVFDHWEANEVFDNDNGTISFEMMFTEDIHFTAVFQGASVAHPLAITEMMFHADSQNEGGDWIELKNNTNVPIDLSQWQLKDANYFNTYTFEEGTTLAAQGYLVIAENLESFMNQYPNVNNAVGSLSFGLSNSADAVHLLQPSGATYISFQYTDSSPQELICSDGCGYTRQHAAVIANYQDNQWQLGCLNGTPGEDNTNCSALLYVHEINYNSTLDENTEDWIELVNPTNSALNLSGWILRDGNDNAFTIPNGTTLTAGARLILATDLAAFQTVNTGVTNAIGPTGLAFSNNGDGVKIYDNNNALVYSMKYNDEAPWPFETDGLGKTLEYSGGGPNVCSAQSWFAGCFLGSPGIAYDPNCGAITVHEMTTAGNMQIFPNPSAGLVQLKWETDEWKILTLYDLTGRIVWQTQPNGATQLNIDLTHLPIGVYQLKCDAHNGDSSITKITLMR